MTVSRVARQPIKIPDGVDIVIKDGQCITVKGRIGKLTQTLHNAIKVVRYDNELRVTPISAIDNDLPKKLNALVGTTRALIQNMVRGVCDGFQRKLVMIGIGYRAQARGQLLSLMVGFSHPVDIEIPNGIVVKTPSATEIVVSGIDRQIVCQVAANIRSIRPPEPYKGKGIRYDGEHVSCKEAKKK
ncbi:50S ribosomal protein L6 [Coxiella endosymbiont of Amblyomma americanum]|uniref:50S ribosomal protein L6 n=1 Tax=Coxiella endosymbiont of Amblyomma americanum TaxID=325775 RepID=UPI0005808E88|nr:50S ribosomal protein L6 [Coxiella endosymbiont of Amblyomma americanum]AJC50438.1 50S ribosomal protein L6 [Coxiella endosymbiont of Amblyomma americanum]AUJ58778.1 50S ribosomal protein L6 [Coxiella-like endosymbiont of Amblyomma americanum]